MKQYPDQPIRISPQQTEQIIHQLWHSELFAESEKPPYVYAILDGARNRNIQPLLKSSGVRHYCLFEGELDYSLTLAAPYMMRLEEDADFTRELIQQAWGNSWGIFAIAPHNISLIRVRMNCKEIVFVESEKGKKMLFRYYDPRVLRNILPSFSSDQLKQFFGPVSQYMVENESASGLHCYALDKNQGMLKLNDSVIPLFDNKSTAHGEIKC